MAERETQRTRDVDVDVDIPDDVIDDSTPAESQERDSGFRERAKQILSPQSLLVALATIVGGVLLLGGLLPFGTVGTLFGIFVASFLYGTVTDSRRYAELGLSGGIVGGLTAILGNLTLTLLGPGVPIALVGAVGGLLAGVFGHYFGRDLRHGLTQEI